MDRAPQLGADRWHTRFTQQAAWTKQTRSYLADQLGLAEAARILEVGCGTGAITSDLGHLIPGRLFGLDISPAFLRKAARDDARTAFTCADAFRLPFDNHSFSHSVCHFLLLWLASPLQALKEMARVTQNGGYLILFAEPDYSFRIDYPDSLQKLGQLQADALASQGANPSIGRTIAHLLVEAGCTQVHSGLMGGQWGGRMDAGFVRSEQELLRADLSDALPEAGLENLLAEDLRAWMQGTRILFVPTFYAWGRVP